MQGAIHSINVSGSGGVPKVSVKATMVNFEGLEGDYNRYRTERKAVSYTHLTLPTKRIV